MFRILAVMLIALTTGTAWADDAWRLSGFASLSAGKIQDDELSYLGYDDEWSYKGDSVLGLQLSGDIAERLSFNIQALARSVNFEGDEFKPELEWMFLRYQLNSNWRLRAGRMRTPHYLYSETLDVGYSYVWVRPPVDVYSGTLAPFSHYDGLDLAYIKDFNDTSLDVQIFTGRMDRKNDNLKVNVNPMLGGNLTLHNGPYTLRYGLIYNNTDIEVAVSDLFQETLDYYTNFVPEYETLQEAVSTQNAWYRYQTLGLRWQDYGAAITSEIFEIKNTDSGYSNDAQGWYVSAQIQWGRFTPYVVTGGYNNEYNQDTLDVIEASVDAIPLGLDAGFDQFRNGSYYTVMLNNFEQSTWAVGLRYDVSTNIAIKAEWLDLNFSSRKSRIEPFTVTDLEDTALLTFVIDVVF